LGLKTFEGEVLQPLLQDGPRAASGKENEISGM